MLDEIITRVMLYNNHPLASIGIPLIVQTTFARYMHLDTIGYGWHLTVLVIWKVMPTNWMQLPSAPMHKHQVKCVRPNKLLCNIYYHVNEPIIAESLSRELIVQYADDEPDSDFGNEDDEARYTMNCIYDLLAHCISMSCMGIGINWTNSKPIMIKRF